MADNPIVIEAIDICDCRLVAPGYVNQNAGVNEVGHRFALGAGLPARVVAKAVHICHAIGDVLAVRPHAGELKIANGPWLSLSR
jgi:hypothetical protein